MQEGNLIPKDEALDIKGIPCFVKSTMNPTTREELCTLPGVGRKSANVMLSEYYKKPALAVDTHVARCAKRLGLSKEEDVLKIENDLCSLFNEEDYYKVHHCLIFFGRYLCKATKPDCDKCLFITICKK